MHAWICAGEQSNPGKAGGRPMGWAVLCGRTGETDSVWWFFRREMLVNAAKNGNKLSVRTSRIVETIYDNLNNYKKIHKKLKNSLTNAGQFANIYSTTKHTWSHYYTNQILNLLIENPIRRREIQ